MNRVRITRSESQLVNEIDREAKKLYRNRYGKRSPASLSSQELDVIMTDAGKRVQERRKGRLVP